MRFRRKQLPEELIPALDAFRAVLAEVEPAKEGLAQVVPGTRLPGRPLPDALVEFEERLGRARHATPSWRTLETEAVWIRCEQGLEEGRPEPPVARRRSGGRALSEDRSNSRHRPRVAFGELWE
jgi:hypothetical protein